MAVRTKGQLEHNILNFRCVYFQVSPVLYFRFVELRVHSNYGNPSYTCLYRFRVHGVPYVQKYNQ